MPDDSQVSRPSSPQKFESNPEYAPHVPEFLQQALAAGHKIGVVLVSYRSRRLDKDNLVGGGKGTVDALRYCGYINNDDPDNVEVFYLQRRCKRKEERTEIYLFTLCH